MATWDYGYERPVRVFYPLRAGVEVTDRWLTVHGQRYALEHMAAVGWQHGLVPPQRRTVFTMIGAGTVLAVVLAAGEMLAFGPSVVTGLIAALYVVSTIALLQLAFHRWPTPLELQADYRGEPRVLYTSSDPTEFRKVCRAVMRAMELNEGELTF